MLCFSNKAYKFCSLFCVSKMIRRISSGEAFQSRDSQVLLYNIFVQENNQRKEVSRKGQQRLLWNFMTAASLLLHRSDADPIWQSLLGR